MYRTESFDNYLSEELKNSEVARGYLLEALKDMDLLDALKEVISCMGTKEFSTVSGIKAPNVSRFLKQDELPKVETLNKFLAHFNLRVKIEVEDAA